MVDPGVEDKRMLVIEAEFARTLDTIARDGNTLSSVIREAWDSGTLNVLTKNNSATSTNAHISVIGHITVEELLKKLSATETANGFGNRFLWIYVTRSKLLPFGGQLSEDALDPIASRLRNAKLFAERCGQIRFDNEAAKLWCEVYPKLSEGAKGLVGKMTSRSEAHAFRLATLYAVLDLSG
ncbi:MAG: hypothetical protein ACJ746_30595 [Bryobacteraceae bacterium]